MKRLSLIAVLAATVIGAQAHVSETDTTSIVVYRPWYYNAALSSVGFGVSVDGGPVIKIKNASYHRFTVTPGHHRVTRNGYAGQDPLEVDVKKNETLYIRTHPGSFVIEFEIDDDQAKAASRLSHFQERTAQSRARRSTSDLDPKSTPPGKAYTRRSWRLRFLAFPQPTPAVQE
jgi:hypothetical protein